MDHPGKTKSPDSESCRRPGDVTCAYDLSGNITFLSKEGEQLSGYTAEEARQMNIADLLDPDHAALVCEQILTDATKCVGTVFEIEILAKDGRRVPLEVSTRVVLLAEDRFEIQGIAVPSVIRNPARPVERPRCLDREFFFVSPAAANETLVFIS